MTDFPRDCAVTIYTDGAAKGNPGPAGWGWWIADDVWDCGGWPEATNNVGELTAVEKALEALEHRRDLDVTVVTDSLYVMKSMTEYIKNWKRNGWRTAAKKPVANVEIIRAIDSLIVARGGIKWEWQRGHVGAHGNTQADELASNAAESFRYRTPCPKGPGFPRTELDGEAVPRPVPDGGPSQEQLFD